MLCILVRTLRIERSIYKDPVDFEQCVEKGEILNLKWMGFCGSDVDLCIC